MTDSKFANAGVKESREVFEQIHKIWLQLQIFDPSSLTSKPAGDASKKKRKNLPINSSDWSTATVDYFKKFGDKQINRPPSTKNALVYFVRRQFYGDLFCDHIIYVLHELYEQHKIVEQMDGVSKQLLNPHSQTFLVDFVKLPLRPWVTKSNGTMLPPHLKQPASQKQKAEQKDNKSDEDKIAWGYQVLLGLNNIQSLLVMDLLSAIRAHKLVITLIVSRFNDIKNSQCAQYVAGGASRELETFNKWMGVMHNFSQDLTKLIEKSEQTKKEKTETNAPSSIKESKPAPNQKGKQDRKRPLSEQKSTDVSTPDDVRNTSPAKRQRV